jgi:hypothetical protein
LWKRGKEKTTADASLRREEGPCAGLGAEDRRWIHLHSVLGDAYGNEGFQAALGLSGSISFQITQRNKLGFERNATEVYFCAPIIK